MRLILPLFLIAVLAVPEAALAAEKSPAYTAGYIVGTLFMIALVVAVGVWIVRKLVR